MTPIRWAAVGLALLLVLLALGEELSKTFRRQSQRYQAEYGRYLTRAVLIQPTIFAVLALLMRDLWLTPFLLVVAGLVGYYRVRQGIEEAGEIKIHEVLQLVVAFRGAYYLQPAVFASLQAALERIEGRVGEIASVAVETFFLTSSPERAFDEFRERTDNVLLHQFAYILEMGEETSSETMLRVLDAFIRRLRSHEDLQRQVTTGLTSVVSETRFLQSFVVVEVFAVALLPFMRNIWVSGALWRMGYVIIISLALGVSYYVERQIQGLRERIR